MAAREASVGIMRRELPMIAMARLRHLPPMIAAALLAFELGGCTPSRFPESEAEGRLRDVLTDQARDVVSGTVERWNTALRTEVGLPPR